MEVTYFIKEIYSISPILQNPHFFEVSAKTFDPQNLYFNEVLYIEDVKNLVEKHWITT